MPVRVPVPRDGFAYVLYGECPRQYLPVTDYPRRRDMITPGNRPACRNILEIRTSVESIRALPGLRSLGIGMVSDGQIPRAWLMTHLRHIQNIVTVPQMERMALLWRKLLRDDMRALKLLAYQHAPFEYRGRVRSRDLSVNVSCLLCFCAA